MIPYFNSCFSFSYYFAVIERLNGIDYVGLFDSNFESMFIFLQKKSYNKEFCFLYVSKKWKNANKTDESIIN